MLTSFPHQLKTKMVRKYCILCNKKETPLNPNGICSPCQTIYDTAQNSNSDPSDDLTPSEQRIVDALSFKMDAWKSEILVELKSKDEKIDSLSREVDSLKATVAKMEEQIDSNEAYERRDCLVFTGSSIPAYTTGENTINLACDLLKTKLNLEVSPSNISTGHRLGNRSAAQGEDRRPIILKFCRREIKNDITSSCRTMKPENFYANENLTPTRSKILYVLRQAKKRHPNKIASCKSIDGKVLAWVKPPRPDAPGARNTRVSLNTKASLEKFLHDILETSLSNIYPGEWAN